MVDSNSSNRQENWQPSQHDDLAIMMIEVTTTYLDDTWVSINVDQSNIVAALSKSSNSLLFLTSGMISKHLLGCRCIMAWRWKMRPYMMMGLPFKNAQTNSTSWIVKWNANNPRCSLNYTNRHMFQRFSSIMLVILCRRQNNILLWWLVSQYLLHLGTHGPYILTSH